MNNHPNGNLSEMDNAPKAHARDEAWSVADGLGFLSDVPLEISVEIGRRKMVIGELLSLGPSAVIELNKVAGEPLDVRVNNILVARGEPVVVNDRFGVRLTSLIEPANLLSSLGKNE